MATVIYFAAADGERLASIRVEEEVNAVLDKFNAAGGVPFQLTRAGSKQGEPVIVNPANIAYWYQASDPKAYTL